MVWSVTSLAPDLDTGEARDVATLLSSPRKTGGKPQGFTDEGDFHMPFKLTVRVAGTN